MALNSSVYSFFHSYTVSHLQVTIDYWWGK